ncbi:MAG: ACP S-malonyltransferase [Alphaproteobacteria bacterium]
MTRAFIFPGQGSQTVGMGQDLAENFAEAREVFEEIDESLSQKLSAMMFSGEADDLNLTENTQPALMAVSMAVVRVLEKQGGINLAEKATFVAGHSLGEYSALTAAGALGVSECAKLLKLRGQAMQRAVPVGQGAMAAILGLDFDVVAALAAEASTEAESVEAANDNSVGQVVVSGHKEAVERAIALASEKGAKRALLLPVSAPFHSKLMAPAAAEMRDALADANIAAPNPAVVSNVLAASTNDAQAIRGLLVDQITGMVRWRESVIWMKVQGVSEMVELGAGKVLCGLVRRIDKEITTGNAGNVAEIEALIEALS